MPDTILSRKIFHRLPASVFLLTLLASPLPDVFASNPRGSTPRAAQLRESKGGRTRGSDRPLWPGSRFTEGQRARAVRRGLRFIYGTALVEDNFREYGSDYLWCFYTVGASVSDAGVRSLARGMGVERARHWRRTHRSLPEDASAAEVSDHAFGSDAADGLGLRDERLKGQIRRAAARFDARDFLLFDPASEPPPADVPAECEFDKASNARGVESCRRCGRRLRMRTRADVWYDALITAYVGDRYGVRLGATYADVLRWLPKLRPYPGGVGADEEFYDKVYAVTHVVYTLNDYGRDRLPRELLPAEFEFLKENLREAIRREDADMLGEFMDSLRAFGMTEADAEIRAGAEYLLTHQNPDGSWGDAGERDIYMRYHPTWNAVAALSDYAWRGPAPRPSKLASLRAAERESEARP